MARLNIDLSVSGIERSTKGFTNFSESIEKNLALQKGLSQQLKQVSSALKSGDGDYVKLRGQQESIRQSVNALNRDLRNQVKVMGSTDGSITQMRAKLNTLRHTYDNLSGAQRKNAGTTKTLVAEINRLNREVTKAEQGTGRFQRSVGNYGNVLRGALPQLAYYATAAGGVALAFQGVRDAYRTIADFDSGLRNVEKTTGLARDEITALGAEFVELSRNLQTVSTNDLTQYATVAGQLGVKGTQNILAFTEALAKLETATNISGEQGGSEIARTLTLIEGGVQNVRDFGDEIVNLGNNFAATEGEILENAQAIAQNTTIYGFARQEVLGYAAASKALGIQQEIVGSTFQKTLGTFERAIRTGKGLDEILKVVGGTAGELGRRFQESASGVLQDYIKGLNDISRAGGSVMEQMERNGIVDIRQRRVIGTLATGYDTLASALDTVRSSAGSLDEEFTVQSGKMIKQTERIGIAWENLVLTIDNGEGAIGASTKRVSGFFANVLDSLTDLVKESTNFGDLFAAFSPGYVIDAALEKGRRQREGRTDQSAEEILSGFGGLNVFKQYDALGQKAEEVVRVQERVGEQVVKNRDYWAAQVKSIKDTISALDVSKKGTEEWTQAQEALAKAQEKLNLYNDSVSKSRSPSSSGGKSQADLIREANDALSRGQVGALRGIDSQLLRIDNKYKSIFDRINKITDATTRGQLTSVANVNKELEKSNARLDAFLKTHRNGFTGTGLGGLTNTALQSGQVGGLPLLERNQDRFNSVYGRNAVSNLGENDMEDRLSKVVERGLRSGFRDVFNSIDDLGSNFFEVFSNVFTKLADTVTNTFGQVISTQLGKLLNDRIDTDDFSVAGLGSDASKAVIAGGGLLGSILSAQGQERANTGLSIAGGALSGAAAGLAFGPWGAAIGGVIGAISGIFQSSGAKKAEKQREEQLAEQRKATAIQERIEQLTYSSSIIGQRTNQGVVTSVDRDAFGNLVANIKGSDIQLVLDRSNNNR